ncbi:MAG: Crp/Fnr family transcriptional regulator [Alphaproteobacteria bacterium]|jgi:CRP-like cAMP-binding protein|nr:Crp/Fnr family transcriptional regulator [Alphaproteobacteria bacterium]
MSDILHTMISLYEAMQRERGYAALSPMQHTITEDFTFNDLSEQTHKYFTLAQKNQPDFLANLPKHFLEAYALRDSESFRNNMKQDALIEWYLFNLEYPLHQILLGKLTTTPLFSPSQMSALIHYIASLFYLCQLRDRGATIYAHGEVSKTEIDLLTGVAKAYLSRQKLFYGLADEGMKKIIDGNDGYPDRAINHANQIILRIQNGQAKSVLSDVPFKAWYTAFVEEIEHHYETLRKTVVVLIDEGLDLATHSRTNQALDIDVEMKLPHIGALPIFRSISDSTLRSMLKGSRLVDYAKNTTFLRQGETPSKFFIILDGWVKTYKINQDGQESILQIAGKRECLLDMGITHNVVSALAAKTITKSQILALPSAVMRDHIISNRELAQNILSLTQQRLMRLVGQYEQITLHSAIQRVGWFMANLRLETGLDGEPLNLPFDKALIASYLNIKPETFSRVLKNFRDRGFTIDKHQIILPSPHSLCEYCEPEMAARCCRADSINCAALQALRKPVDAG